MTSKNQNVHGRAVLPALLGLILILSGTMLTAQNTQLAFGQYAPPPPTGGSGGGGGGSGGTVRYGDSEPPHITVLTQTVQEGKNVIKIAITDDSSIRSKQITYTDSSGNIRKGEIAKDFGQDMYKALINVQPPLTTVVVAAKDAAGNEGSVSKILFVGPGVLDVDIKVKGSTDILANNRPQLTVLLNNKHSFDVNGELVTSLDGAESTFQQKVSIPAGKQVEVPVHVHASGMIGEHKMVLTLESMGVEKSATQMITIHKIRDVVRGTSMDITELVDDSSLSPERMLIIVKKNAELKSPDGIDLISAGHDGSYSSIKYFKEKGALAIIIVENPSEGTWTSDQPFRATIRYTLG